MTLVVDASVAMKWLFEEHDTAAALGLLDRDERRIAPTLVVPEVCNAVWKRVRRRETMAQTLVHVARAIPSYFAELASEADLAPRAAAIALELDHPVYDCFYLALAEREDARLVTADRRLVERLAGTAWKARIEAL